MTSVRRSQAERSAATRETLLDATIDCLIEEGYASTTTSRVAERAGLSRGAHLHHFQTRNALVAAAVEQLAERWLAELRDASAALPEDAGRTLAGLDLLWAHYASPALPGGAGPLDRRPQRPRPARAPGRGRAAAGPPDARARRPPVPRARGHALRAGPALGGHRPRPGDARHAAPGRGAQPRAVGLHPPTARGDVRRGLDRRVARAPARGVVSLNVQGLRVWCAPAGAGPRRACRGGRTASLLRPDREQPGCRRASGRARGAALRCAQSDRREGRTCGRGGSPARGGPLPEARARRVLGRGGVAARRGRAPAALTRAGALAVPGVPRACDAHGPAV